MAGHSKWANIKHRKGAQDAKRSKEFQKVSKEIMVAIKEAGNDPTTNSRLRLAIEKAKSINMPNDNIKRLLEKSNKDDAKLFEVTYEGYGPGGVAILVECLTDNLNRTAPQVKAAFSKNGGNLGTSGSVSYMFDLKGQFVIDGNDYEVDFLMETVMELDILDFKDVGEYIIIETLPTSFLEVKESLEMKSINKFISAKIGKIPNTTIEIEDEEVLKKIEKLTDVLEDLDDVQNVYDNLE